jgi:uncharacterized membrane protein YcaP (DUF421 family)
MEAGVQAKKQYLPITIVGDGYLYRENLALAKKDENWLARVLKEKGAELKEVWLLTVDGADHMVFLRKEQQT